MNSVATRKPRSKPVLHVTCHTPPEGDQPGVLHLGLGKADETSYFVYPIASDFGRGFRLVKVRDDGTEPYHVLLNGQQSSCECLGFLAHGHCKHVDSLTQLVAEGKL